MPLAYWYVCVFVWGRGVLPMMAYTGKLRPKGVPPFSNFRHMKGSRFACSSIFNGSEICQFSR